MPDGAVSVVVLAAGEGKRMRSATSKLLHTIAGRTLVEHALRATAGITPGHLAVVVGHGGQAVREHLETLATTMNRRLIVAEQPKQLGTGDAARCGVAALPESTSGTVVVTYGDVPLLNSETLTALLAEHTASGNVVTMLTAVLDNPHGYGRVIRDADNSVLGVVEHKDATEEQQTITEVNSGMYAFDIDVLQASFSQLTTHNAQGELYLTDVLGIARANGHQVGAMVCDDPWLVEGVNDRVQLAKVSAELNRRLVERWMRAGVTFVDPATAWLDVDVELAPDVRIEPNVQLKSGTVIREGTVIGPDTTLDECVVGMNATVVRTHAKEAEIGDNTNVGPYAYLRPGAKLRTGGKIGTFVEVKNSEIGAGSKVPHLSYVGDATIGEHSNIGAATVFVNYDGVRKQRIVIGSHAKTGSDNTFVAPVEVGDGAYTGAGAVIRQNVPPGALAVSSGPQRNLEGWVFSKREGTPAAEAAAKAQTDQTRSSQTKPDRETPD